MGKHHHKYGCYSPLGAESQCSMSQHITDDDRRLFIRTYFNMIDDAVKTARVHMGDEPGCRPDIVDFMFEHIGHLTKFGQGFNWPDPAKLAQDARQDPALQKLIQRASKKTPIRAR